MSVWHRHTWLECAYFTTLCRTVQNVPAAAVPVWCNAARRYLGPGLTQPPVQTRHYDRQHTHEDRNLSNVSELKSELYLL